MKPIYIPSFPTVEVAGRYAELNKPLQKALEDFANRDDYAQYGEAARREAMLCWECASNGDEAGMLKHQKALSRLLPMSVFEYGRKS